MSIFIDDQKPSYLEYKNQIEEYSKVLDITKSISNKKKLFKPINLHIKSNKNNDVSNDETSFRVVLRKNRNSINKNEEESITNNTNTNTKTNTNINQIKIIEKYSNSMKSNTKINSITPNYISYIVNYDKHSLNQTVKPINQSSNRELSISNRENQTTKRGKEFKRNSFFRRESAIREQTKYKIEDIKTEINKQKYEKLMEMLSYKSIHKMIQMKRRIKAKVVETINEMESICDEYMKRNYEFNNKVISSITNEVNLKREFEKKGKFQISNTKTNGNGYENIIFFINYIGALINEDTSNNRQVKISNDEHIQSNFNHEKYISKINDMNTSDIDYFFNLLKPYYIYTPMNIISNKGNTFSKFISDLISKLKTRLSQEEYDLIMTNPDYNMSFKSNVFGEFFLNNKTDLIMKIRKDSKVVEDKSQGNNHSKVNAVNDYDVKIKYLVERVKEYFYIKKMSFLEKKKESDKISRNFNRNKDFDRILKISTKSIFNTNSPKKTNTNKISINQDKKINQIVVGNEFKKRERIFTCPDGLDINESIVYERINEMKRNYKIKNRKKYR